MKKFFSGRKTYLAAFAAIAYGLSQQDYSLVNEGVMALFLRQAIAKGPTAPPSP